MARDRCTLGDRQGAPISACPRPLELTRVLAGAPDTNDIGKCQLKPLNRADYGKVSFTAEQMGGAAEGPSRPASATMPSRWSTSP